MRVDILVCSLSQGENIQYLSIKYNISCRFFVGALYQVEEVHLISYFSEFKKNFKVMNGY